jgi:hypothetical protein
MFYRQDGMENNHSAPEVEYKHRLKLPLLPFSAGKHHLKLSVYHCLVSL